MAGWSAATGSMDVFGALVGTLVFVWTPSHFWCLAMKMKDDYADAKVPMLPVLIGMQKTSKYILLNTAILLPYSVMLVAFGLGYVYLVVAAGFRWSDACLSLQTYKDSNFRICMESIQGYCTIPYNNICWNST